MSLLVRKVWRAVSYLSVLDYAILALIVWMAVSSY